ncbi:DNA-binding IclR family transcriptional regulator [Microbacterium sp. SORGH_AS 1204]|uniref:IclR family transcriptional regulator n=1 Tax=Microbacterium sp. SORGH_AS_1204 TaxID=3041785 RepID=UPI002793AA16|nr:IclR family transcriptional regulator [Microbacterium sp. SORGH_AS_1204]MDQ1136010.1 DNA-binding IclR family transcriptional regulator [Microbacterium sp. SORGH_AS_1204]
MTNADGTDDLGGAGGTVQSVDRAIQILEMLADASSLGVSEISRRLGVHRSTAFRLLATLEARNLVEQEERRGTYQLGFGVLRLAGRITARMDIVKDAQQVCDELTNELNETSNVAIFDNGAAVNVSQATGTRLVSVTRQYVGQRTPLHATSTGKVLLAHAPADVVRHALSQPLEQCTGNTLTSPAALEAHLELVRERGWAAAAEEWEYDTNALAVPVSGQDGSVVAALSITAPSFRMPEASFPGLVDVLKRHARQLGARLGAAV